MNGTNRRSKSFLVLYSEQEEGAPLLCCMFTNGDVNDLQGDGERSPIDGSFHQHA